MIGGLSGLLVFVDKFAYRHLLHIQRIGCSKYTLVDILAGSLIFSGGSSNDIIDTYVVIVCKLYKCLNWNIDFAKFIFGISSLFNIEIISQFLLRLIIIFS